MSTPFETARMGPASGPSPGTGFAIPALFVFLWSSGFIGAKYGLPYCGPLTYLALRTMQALGLAWDLKPVPAHVKRLPT